MNNWYEVKLNDVCIKITDGVHNTVIDDANGVCFLLSCKNIKNGSIVISDNDRRISRETLINLRKRTQMAQGDVVLSSVGTIGEVAIIKDENPGYEFQRSVAIFKPNFEKITSKFLYYSLNYNKSAFQFLAEGAVQQCLFIAPLKNFTISLPPLDVQKRIAEILGALDDQIDVLRRENVVLEQMAQAVFQSWFVDFDIVRAKTAGTPESEVCEKYHITPELYALFPSALTPDGIPLGWEKLPFAETMKIVSGGTPKTTEADFWNGNIPWYSVVDAPASVYVLDTEKHITQQGLENSPCSLLKKDTVIISARGTVGKLAMVGKKMAMNQSCYGLEFDFPYYGYLTTKQMLVYLRQNVHGAVFDTITKDTFKTVETVGVPRALQENFTKLVSSFFEKIYKNTEQIRALSATRDTLLPKLMNGEIEVRI